VRATSAQGGGTGSTGFAATPAGQTCIGVSWRLGVDLAERGLVTDAVLRRRNPIFTATVAAALRIVPMVRTAVVCMRHDDLSRHTLHRVRGDLQ
jgi:hypothetical protein